MTELTIASAADVWAAAQQTRRKPLAASTIATYCDAWRSFTAWAQREGRHTVADIAASDLGAWIDSLKEMADGTVLTYGHGALAICKFLADRGFLRCDLALIRLHLRDALPRAYANRAPDVPDLRKLVSFYDSELPPGEPGSRAERDRLNMLRNAALLHTLFSTGARISEVLSLNADDVRADDGSILPRAFVVGKGQRRRAVFLRAHAQRAILRYLHARRASFPRAEALFISHGPRGAGGRLGRIAAWQIVTSAARRVANQIEREGRIREARTLRAVTPHTFRHFVATWLLNEGAQLSEVSAILGHANTRITEQYYARHTDERLQELHDQFAPDPES
ncbi:MAG: tyrosine-type recombinase/integrase [Roseiflexus sp.]|nr:tyrosine-type recombinase/integrase [Roseiflexus sp.]MCS7290794.1 tyrosine-type recombinase/integrase [Roseiflexus sp.]MDW8144819.1 tyrosine-type recombinase/integrase [Roseiflexaceae bacterium]MDW8232272.1 tyrosine-type recombinase/integrase [Roseiflexaceae bacterium]